MSDSQAKENNSKQPSAKKIISDPVGKPVKFSIANIPTIAYVIGAIAVIGIIWFASILFDEYKASQTGEKSSLERVSGKSVVAPTSILPAAPEGVTVMEKQAELSNSVPTPPISVTSGAASGTGYAMELGSALSFAELSARFAVILSNNGSDNFNRLEPRAVLTETVSGLEAKLLVGPFENEQLAIEGCEVLVLPADVTCKTSRFEGELIARE
ncbi:MAG: hypothetical protein COC00_000225 [Rhizobiales bacterium]|nr:hypothetical protein [Hyphomicrobiales bacterium]